MKKLLLFLSIIFMFGCTEDFTDINTDPTTTTEVPTSNLLTAAIQDLISINSGLGYNKTLMLYSQYWSQREETGRSRYGDINRDWASWYLNGMPELDNIIALNSGDKKDNFIASGSNNNQIAVATILRAWAFHNITDAWGDVPYSEVGDPAIVFPKYDEQSTIYPSLLSELQKASDLIELNEAGVQGDLMYNGDMAKWQKFANSLRARIGMRMSKIDPAGAQSAVAAAFAAGVITDNTEDAIVDFQVEESFANPLFIEFKVQEWTYISDILVNALSQDANFIDPRLPVYAAPTANTGLYDGLEYGLVDTSSNNILQGDRSYPGALVRETTFPSILCTNAEMLFIQAEAAKNGWISGDPKVFYENAIRASMEFWGVADGADNYLMAPHVAYSEADFTEQLGEQKWIAFYMQGAQSWAEYRRIGYPVLNPPPFELQNNATQVPRRFYYDLAEQNTNKTNLDAAISAMGGDNFDVRMWWDKQ